MLRLSTTRFLVCNSDNFGAGSSAYLIDI